MERWVGRVLKATFQRKWLLAVFALVPLCGIGARAEEPRYFAIRHARIVPAAGRPPSPAPSLQLLAPVFSFPTYHLPHTTYRSSQSQCSPRCC